MGQPDVRGAAEPMLAVPGPVAVQVAVIARRGSPTLPACRAALRADGCPEPHVVTVGADGPAQARNAALEACRATSSRSSRTTWSSRQAGCAPSRAPGPTSAPRSPAARSAAPFRGSRARRRPTPAERRLPGGRPARGGRLLAGPRRRRPARLVQRGARGPARDRAAGVASAWVPRMAARRVGDEPGLRQRLRTGARRQAIGEPRPAPRPRARS